MAESYEAIPPDDAPDAQPGTHHLRALRPTGSRSPVAAISMLVCLVASYLPARRISRVYSSHTSNIPT